MMQNAPTTHAARPGVRTVFLKNPAAMEIAHGFVAARDMGAHVSASFRTKPGQSASLALGYVVWSVDKQILSR